MDDFRKIVILLLTVTFASACGGTATKKDRASVPGPDSPDDGSFTEQDASELVVTPYLTKWQFNEVYGDVDGKAGVRREFKYAPAVKTELKLGWQEIQTTECLTAGESSPVYTLFRLAADGSELSRKTLGLEQRFVVEAQESVRIRVSLANAAHCKALEVLLGVNGKAS